MLGMDARTGGPLTGAAHLRQSVLDIVTTILGSRPMRRDYGLPSQLLSGNLTRGWQSRFAAAALDALARWEPRAHFRRVRYEFPAPGQVRAIFEGQSLQSGAPVEVALAGRAFSPDWSLAFA